MTHATLITIAEQAPVLASPNERVYTLAEFVEIYDWDPSVRRWVAYASHRLSRHGSASARYEKQAHDCVQEAICLTLAGDRHFECGTRHDFFAFICGVIDSLISHDGEKARRHGVVVSITSNDKEEGRTNELNEECIPSHEDPEHDVLFRVDLQRFLDSLESDLAGYARLRAEKDGATAEDYARLLGVSVEDIRNMDRRLRRRRQQWLKPEMQTTRQTVM